jgi:two-component system chemotaxis response regulator CheY
MKSFLVVDDSRVVRKVTRRIVEELGFSCEEAEDGQKAYDLCAASMPDAIILDWNMPIMSGIEFLERLRQLPGGGSPKVILCTTENDMAHIQRALQAGANEYIMKPFDSAIVRSKLVRIGLLE